MKEDIELLKAILLKVDKFSNFDRGGDYMSYSFCYKRYYFVVRTGCSVRFGDKGVENRVNLEVCTSPIDSSVENKWIHINGSDDKTLDIVGDFYQYSNMIIDNINGAIKRKMSEELQSLV